MASEQVLKAIETHTSGVEANPPMFPHVMQVEDAVHVTIGARMRDGFAMAALKGILANAFHSQPTVVECREEWRDRIAKTSYDIADAMMKARGM